jgi:hypothetical protein
MSFSLVPQPATDRSTDARQPWSRAASEGAGASGTFEGLVQLLAVLGDGRDGGGDGERRHCVGSGCRELRSLDPCAASVEIWDGNGWGNGTCSSADAGAAVRAGDTEARGGFVGRGGVRGGCRA